MKFIVCLCLSALTSTAYSYDRLTGQDWRRSPQSREVVQQRSTQRPVQAQLELTPDQELIFAVKGVKAGVAFLAGIMTLSPTVVTSVLATNTPESRQDILKIDALLAKGADIDCTDGFGWTPLMYAADGGHPAIAKHLIENRARKDISGSWGTFTQKDYTPLEIAQYYLNKYRNIARRDGARPNPTTQDYIERYAALVKILGEPNATDAR